MIAVSAGATAWMLYGLIARPLPDLLGFVTWAIFIRFIVRGRYPLLYAVSFVLTMGLERLNSKETILESYLNTTYFGRGVYGVQAAAHSYFHKDVRSVTLQEAAYLAGLIHAPRHLSTLGDVIPRRPWRPGPRSPRACRSDP